MLKVVQCWDDGVYTDLRLTELLRKYNAKATFNLNPGFLADEPVKPFWQPLNHVGWSHHGFAGGRVGRKQLREIYDGFQVASHCFRHEVAGNVPDDVFLKAALDARNFLEELFERECRGFAWPCGAFTPSTVRGMRELGFAYGRTTRNTDDVAACQEPMTLDSSCHFQACDFMQKYEQAKQTGVFYFWGHSYEMYEYDPLWEQLEAKIRYISEDPDAVWADVIDIVPECSR